MTQANRFQRRSISQNRVGILGRCDSPSETPRLFLPLEQVQSLISSGELTWIEPLEPNRIARKTYLYEAPAKQFVRQRKRVAWVARASGYLPDVYLTPDEMNWLGGELVMQAL